MEDKYVSLSELAKRFNLTPNQVKWFTRKYLSEIRFERVGIKSKVYHLEDFRKVLEERINFWNEGIKSLLKSNK
jgi:hypothetical protein